MRLVESDGVYRIVFPALEEAGLVCAVSCKPVNVRVEADRRALVAGVGLDPDRAARPRQVHRSQVLRVDGPLGARPEVDGLVTDVAGQPLLLSAADCSLVVVADPAHRAVGVAHAGWKGSARGVVVNLVKALHSHYGTEPSRCLAAIGPTIGQARYPVGGEVPAAFLGLRSWAGEYVAAEGEEIHFDLAGVNARFLAECGIPERAIDVCRLCTHSTDDLFWSFRRDGTGAGHQGMVAGWPGR